MPEINWFKAGFLFTLGSTAVTIVIAGLASAIYAMLLL